MPSYGRIDGAAEDAAVTAPVDIRSIDQARSPRSSRIRSVGLAIVGSAAVAASVLAVTSNVVNAPDARNADGSVQGYPLPDEAPQPMDPSGEKTTSLEYISPFPHTDDTNSFTEGLKTALADVSESDGFLFGHHMTTYSGQYFQDKDSENHHSDVYNATGKFPLVYGFDFAKVIDGDGDFVQHVTDAYGRGGVMSFMWLAPNPMNGADSYNKSGNPCVELQPGGKANTQWLSYLDTISDFLKEIHPIPVVFRLFHEMTGWWYWWGIHSCETEDFIDAFQYTVDYLKDYKGNDNMLMFYATSRIASDFTKYQQANVTQAMRDCYPGDDYVDVIGFDCYDNLTYYAESLNATCSEIFSFAEEQGKIPVIGETGHTDGMGCENCGEWFDEFLSVYNDPNSLCSKAAYAITWENYNTRNFYIPLENQEQYSGFVDFASSGESMFQHDEYWREQAVSSGYLANSSSDTMAVKSATGGQPGGKSVGKKSGMGSTLSTDDAATDDSSTSKGKADEQNSKTHASKTNDVGDSDGSCGKGCSTSTDAGSSDGDGEYTTPADDDDTSSTTDATTDDVTTTTTDDSVTTGKGKKGKVNSGK